MNKVKLHAGYIGKTRAGDRVEIVEHVNPQAKFGYFVGDNDQCYWDDGSQDRFVGCCGDIIGPWEEPAANYGEFYLEDGTLAFYQTSQQGIVGPAAKVGEWIGWNGGECPVHPETVVEVTDGEKKRTNRAGISAWHMIIAYRIITPYVEPKKAREFWLAERNGVMIEVHCHVSDAIHVREVLDDEPADIDGDKPYLFF